MQKTAVVSFSGGRTSAYLVWLIESMRKAGEWAEPVEYIFMDTGAEHPKTYEFIRKVNSEFELNLVCLRTRFNPELGEANSYDIVNIDSIGPDYKPWIDMLRKYGTPYNPGGAFCTDRMKLVPFTKYCNDRFGRKNYTTWLGIRTDEPKRLKPKDGYRFLAEISEFEKIDILDWWDNQQFNLEIPEHLGNCVFCIKKGINKVALAAKDEPLLADAFKSVIESSEVRIVDQRKSPSLEMYRGRQSLGQIIQTFKDIDAEEIRVNLRGAKRFDSGSCSESCEIFSSEQLDLFD
jgi:hypothetical protein